MAVSNLFKHKIQLEFQEEIDEEYHPRSYRRHRCYGSPMLQDIEKVDAPLFKPFVYYMLSKVLHEDRDIIINYVSIEVHVFGLEERGRGTLAKYTFFETLQDYPVLFFIPSEVETHPFPGYLINQPFFVYVDVDCYLMQRSTTPIAPKVEAFKEDCCMICLEVKPNILYLDCLHIAVCDSCDNLKNIDPLVNNKL